LSYCAFLARLLIVAAALLALGRPLAANAQESETTDAQKERTVKAVFLYGFGRYVEWPNTAFAASTDPFVIGVLGEDPISDTLDAIAKKKTLKGRRIVVNRFASLDDLKGPCHILFVSGSPTSEQQSAIIAKMAGKPVLVVGETSGFAERGGMANFARDGEYVSFEINVAAARRSQLEVNSKLLSLAKAKLVGGEPPSTTQ
jgi:hypothetical protein